MKKQPLKQLQDWLEQLALRERALVLLLALVIIWVFWLLIIEKPLQAQQLVWKNKIQNTRKKTAVFENQVRIILLKVNQYKGEYPQRQRDLTEQLMTLEANLVGYKTILTSTADMALLIKRFLGKNNGLELKAFISQPASKLISSKQAVVQFRRVDNQLALSGSYFQMYRFLQRMERLDEQIFWDELHYKVVNYPQAIVTIKFHTMSIVS